MRKPEDVIETLRRLGLDKFLREKVEVNKDAILAAPKEVEGIAGINIKSGIEDFEIIPFEQTLTE